MRLSFLIAVIVLTALPAAADDRAVFYGTWGTPGQCARTSIMEGGTVMAEPFMINSGWLRHGQIWCRLDWGPLETRENDVVTGAQALCGEDAVRSYLLGLTLSDENLTLRWDFTLTNGPLKRCPGQ